MSESQFEPKPLVYACAGCSFAGRLAYDLALELDRRGIAQMSCLAGVAAEKKSFLAQLTGRPVWIIDGCAIECAKGVFDRLGKRVDRYIRLHEFGIKKKHPPQRGVDMDELVNSVLSLTSS